MSDKEFDYIPAGWHDGDGATAEFDQVHAKALELLRTSQSFFLSVVLPDGGVEHISAAGGEGPVSAEGFYIVSGIEAMRLARISRDT